MLWFGPDEHFYDASIKSYALTSFSKGRLTGPTISYGCSVSYLKSSSMSPENLNTKSQLVTEILHFDYRICLQLDNTVLFCLLTLASFYMVTAV